MSFTTMLGSLREPTADPKNHRTWPVALGRLRGHRDAKLGIEWLFSREVYDKLGLDPRERARGETPRRVAAGMRAHGWTRQLVGPRSARESGFRRALKEDRATDAVPVSPHHAVAVDEFRAALDRLADYGLNDAQLDKAYDAARGAT